MSMLRDVGQRFLRYSIEARFDLRRQPLPYPFGIELDGNRVGLRPGSHKHLKSSREPDFVENRRPQLPRKQVEFVVDEIDERQQFFYTAGSVAAFIPALELFDVEAKSTNPSTKQVVQVPGNAAALLFSNANLGLECILGGSFPVGEAAVTRRAAPQLRPASHDDKSHAV